MQLYTATFNSCNWRKTRQPPRPASPAEKEDRAGKSQEDFGSDHRFLGELGYFWEGLMHPLFFSEAYVSSNVAKIKNTATLNEVRLLIFALKLKAGQRWGSYSYKTRRQLVHCRIDVESTRRNVVVNPPYLVQNSQTTRALSHRCRDYTKKCRSKPVKSRHYTVLCRSKSYGTRRQISHYVAMVDMRPRTRDNRRHVYENCIRQSTDELRDQYKKSSAHFGRRVVARFLNPSKIS